ncbi:conserved hypothetical protein [Methanospirillum hungatei JF-1]|jgi:pimeloyl-ACP methyl ester carboxylesterase|uniref:AB hydrolase-1 domain-containing protein n=3 Tax=Methanospirillum hungatei TaxID=2203 RepID=Q2FMF9_METHJ|nr:conserved hypothetical protein [Methanospirillum hungatei JF-1]OQA57645.1 MAG: Alpha/beta hydrolase family protein [Euryarchaeota archaeon ADurb.Bin294]
MNQRFGQEMKYRSYGPDPKRIALIHGGPGAPGEMGPVARYLADYFPIIEPFQTGLTIHDQIEELAKTLRTSAEIPVILVGYSWGAWLSGMVAGRYPELVYHLILISAGPLEEQYAVVWKNRMERLTPDEQETMHELMVQIQDSACPDRDRLLKTFGSLIQKVDSFCPIQENKDEIGAFSCDPEIFSQVWAEAAKMRQTGELLSCFQQISCPVTAIHGDYDPHPVQGVIEPLTRILPRFTSIVIPDCGHCPWEETVARNIFFSVLHGEISGIFPSLVSIAR